MSVLSIIVIVFPFLMTMFQWNITCHLRKYSKIKTEIYPCGMPKRIFSHETKVELSLILCVRLERYSSKSLRLSMLTPYACSFAKISSCGRRSNALERSIRTVPTTPDLSRQLCHLSVKLSNACWVLYVLNGNHTKQEIIYF